MIDTNSWEIPPLFRWLQKGGNVEQTEMYRTLNCGVGIVIAVPADKKEQAIALLTEAGESAWEIGHIAEASQGQELVELAGL